MRPFKARFGRYVAVLEPAETMLLADLVSQVRTLLATRRETSAPDPLADLVGVSMGPSEAPQDAVLARLLPSFHREDENLSAGMRMLREPEVVAAKDDAAAILLDSLPAGGGTVRLDLAAARAWLVAVGDVRLAFGVRLRLPEDGSEPAAATADRASPEWAMYATYRWLTALQESLTRALLDGVDHRG